MGAIKRTVWQFIAHRRSNRLVSTTATLAEKYLDAFNSRGAWQFDQDGERHMIDRLSSLNIRTVFDVGANIGDWSVMAAAAFPQATIHAFEVVPSTSELLRQNTQAFSRIIVNDFGLADEAGNVDIQVGYPGSPHATFATPPSGEVLERGVLRVGTDYARENNLTHVDFLKIDAEGSDHLVLQGFRTMVEEQAIDIIQFEYGPWALQTRYLLTDFYSFLERSGYRVGKLHPTGVSFKDFHRSAEDFCGLNYVAVPRKLQDILCLIAE